MKIVYLAGAMSGRPAYNHAAFMVAKARLEAMGYLVEIPLDASSRVWRRHFGRDFDPYTDTCEYGSPILREMFAQDVASLMRADVFALLDDWRESRGAKIELQIAKLFAMPILSEHGLEIPDCWV